MPAQTLLVGKLLTKRVHNAVLEKQIPLDKYKFIFAQNIEEALEKIKSEPEIDLVLSDLSTIGQDTIRLYDEMSVNVRTQGCRIYADRSPSINISMVLRKNLVDTEELYRFLAFWDFEKPFLGSNKKTTKVKERIILGHEVDEKVETEKLTDTELLQLLKNGLLDGCLKEKCTTITLISGKIKNYGPCYRLQWRENGKLCSRFLGKENPVDQEFWKFL